MLRIVEFEYPDPKYRYGVFYLGDNEIGRADKADGGGSRGENGRHCPMR